MHIEVNCRRSFYERDKKNWSQAECAVKIHQLPHEWSNIFSSRETRAAMKNVGDVFKLDSRKKSVSISSEGHFETFFIFLCSR